MTGSLSARVVATSELLDEQTTAVAVQLDPTGPPTVADVVAIGDAR